MPDLIKKFEDLENPIWLSVSESAKIGGVTSKTIRRAIASKQIKYKIIKNRYLINLSSVIKYLHTNTKLMNKFYQNGIGQYFLIFSDDEKEKEARADAEADNQTEA